jgi:hypothetical protein
MKVLRAVVVSVVTLAGALLAAPRATWAADAAAAAAPAANVDAAILPFIDEGTFLVGRLDVEKVDQDAIEGNFDQMSESVIKVMGVPANQHERLRANGREAAGKAKDWLSGMKAAGVPRVYLVLDSADFLAGTDDPIFVAPLGEHADAEAVRGLLNMGSQIDNVEQIGKAMVYGKTKQRERLKNLVGTGDAKAKVDRPEVVAALASAGDAPARVALVPGEFARTFVEQALPTLPEMFGGGETKTLSRGMKWAAIGITQKPDAKAHLKVRAANAEQAKALLEVINKGTESAKATVAASADAEENGKLLEAIKPTLAGETISIDLDPVLIVSGLRAAEPMFSRQARPATPGQAPANSDGGL